jgi:hypothetical protein
VFSYAPVLDANPLTHAMFRTIMMRSFCGTRPVFTEIGVAADINRHGPVRIRLAISASLSYTRCAAMTNGWTGGQYSLFRILLGTYLCIHFLHLLPWSAELFSNQGLLPDGRLSPIFANFPNLFAISDAPWFVYASVAAAAAAAIAFAVGWQDRIAALWMWLVLASLFGRNPLILNPSMPYVGFMLLAHLFVPPGPFGSLAARGRPDPDGKWSLPPAVFLSAWVVLALSYSYSGYTKLLSPSWVAGDNIAFVLQNPLARPWFLRGRASVRAGRVMAESPAVDLAGDAGHPVRLSVSAEFCGPHNRHAAFSYLHVRSGVGPRPAIQVD